MMSTTTAESKSALRTAVEQTLSALSDEARRESDEALFVRFLSLPQLQAAQTVLLFYGLGSEPDTARLVPALLQRGKTVALPRCLPGHGMEARVWDGTAPLVRHPYGMWEPAPDAPLLAQNQLDLLLVPGVCYDTLGYRLGRGGGFYDRYLAACGGCTVGLCRSAVLQARVPIEPHDLPVCLVLTESGQYEARPPEGGPAFAEQGL